LVGGEKEDETVKAGILALQGDFHAHGSVFDRLGVAWREVRTAGDFEDIHGLVIPGGESTTLLKLMLPDCRTAVLDLVRRGGCIYGTCAGALLLAREVRNPRQESLGLLDAVLSRNDYGRQNESFVLRREECDPPRDGRPGGRDTPPENEAAPLPSELVFIRAPRITEVGPKVRVLARARGDPVYVRQANILATTFHPELTSDTAVHAYFLKMMEAPIRMPEERKASA
jgi:5'-phosphate synthase pdxT subunit